MKRMDEYQEMLQELETVPEATADCVKRAMARRRRQRQIWRPLASLAAVFCLFIGLVNLSPTVAAACLEIPFLDKLTEAVLFSPSLKKAVENDYVQVMGLEQTQNGISVRVEHVIVDQKQLNIFYTVESDVYDYLVARPDLLETGTEEGIRAGIVYGNDRVTLKEMRHIMADFANETVPSQVELKLDVVAVEKDANEKEPSNAQWDAVRKQEPVASFSFHLEFNPYFTEQGRIVKLNQRFELNGNTFTVAELGIYPSHIRIHLDEAPENPCWLNSLRFHLELDDGTVIGTGGNSISAWGDPDTPSMTTYLAESSYFYDADCIRLMITGADFLEKDFGRTYINLDTGESENLPLGCEVQQIRKTAKGWELNFIRPDDGTVRSQLFTGGYDADGNSVATGGMWYSSGGADEAEMREFGYILENVSGHEVWLEPNYTQYWYAAQPVVVELNP